MINTNHVLKRMNNRGINNTTISFTVEFGEINGDKYIINHKAAKALVKRIKNQVRRLECLLKKFKAFKVATLIARKLESLRKDFVVAKRVCDKKGVVVVCCGSAVITTYNTSSYLKY